MELSAKAGLLGIDTLSANLEHCVGLNGNMIGAKKRILVFTVGKLIVPMINPFILKKEKLYETEESCLSLMGFRKTKIYEMNHFDGVII